eukprot:GILJ01008082.1.p1 GENE.GILJ01008082.1~~GILJ01008082.1.p1  ORF type:complete len:300 (+),score=53.89 GILJ01008082.1:1-900(+)
MAHPSRTDMAELQNNVGSSYPHSIIVTNLPPSTTVESLRNFFNVLGPVQTIEIVDGGDVLTFVVAFVDEGVCQTALQLHGVDFGGQPIGIAKVVRHPAPIVSSVADVLANIGSSAADLSEKHQVGKRFDAINEDIRKLDKKWGVSRNLNAAAASVEAKINQFSQEHQIDEKLESVKQKLNENPVVSKAVSFFKSASNRFSQSMADISLETKKKFAEKRLSASIADVNHTEGLLSDEPIPEPSNVQSSLYPSAGEMRPLQSVQTSAPAATAPLIPVDEPVAPTPSLYPSLPQPSAPPQLL